MPKSFTQIIESNGGQLLFTSNQDNIALFLGGPMANYEGVCVSLVMMWFAQDTSKKDPAKGIINKTKAMNLQNKMESSWGGFDTVKTQGQVVINKNFWYASNSKQTFTSEKLGAEHYLQSDPQSNRESMNIFCIYFAEGPGHAIGVWRFPTGVMVLYDPNHGACVISKASFRGFLNEFLKELYSDTNGYAVCAFYS
jgi:hypothetical protein